MFQRGWNHQPDKGMAWSIKMLFHWEKSPTVAEFMLFCCCTWLKWFSQDGLKWSSNAANDRDIWPLFLNVCNLQVLTKKTGRASGADPFQVSKFSTAWSDTCAKQHPAAAVPKEYFLQLGRWILVSSKHEFQTLFLGPGIPGRWIKILSRWISTIFSGLETG